MPTFSIKHLCLLVLLAGLILPGMAAEPPPPPSIRVMGLGAPLPQGILLEDGNHSLPLQVELNRFSRAQTLTKTPEFLHLYREVPPPEDAPQGSSPLRETLASIALPQTSSQWLVFLKPSPPGSNLPLTGMALDAMPDQHVRGHMRILNFSRHPLGLVLRDQNPLPIQANELHKVVPYSPGIVELLLAVTQQGSWEPILHLQHRWDENFLVYFVILPREPTQDNELPVRAMLIAEYDRSGLSRPNK